MFGQVVPRRCDRKYGRARVLSPSAALVVNTLPVRGWRQGKGKFAKRPDARHVTRRASMHRDRLYSLEACAHRRCQALCFYA